MGHAVGLLWGTATANPCGTEVARDPNPWMGQERMIDVDFEKPLSSI